MHRWREGEEVDWCSCARYEAPVMSQTWRDQDHLHLMLEPKLVDHCHPRFPHLGESPHYWGLQGLVHCSYRSLGHHSPLMCWDRISSHRWASQLLALLSAPSDLVEEGCVRDMSWGVVPCCSKRIILRVMIDSLEKCIGGMKIGSKAQKAVAMYLDIDIHLGKHSVIDHLLFNSTQWWCRWIQKVEYGL